MLRLLVKRMSGLNRELSRNQLFWMCQLSCWLGLSITSAYLVSPAYMEPHQTFPLGLFRAAVAIILTCGFRIVYRRLRTGKVSLPVKTVFALLLSVTAAFIDVTVTRRFAALLGLDMNSELLSAFMQTGFILRLSLYIFWSILYFGINYLLDAQRIKFDLIRAEALANASELKALKAQINPHFLFNALGSIISETGDNIRLRNLVLALSDYLRYSLQIRKHKEPLGNELDALENYLDVEISRFRDKLHYRIDVDDRVRELVVPVALVQPLLENAIKYGQHTSSTGLTIEVRAFTEGNVLTIIVKNSGTWMPPNPSRSTGTGLENIRRRLEILYGDAAALNINTDDGHVEVKVTLPVERPNKAAYENS
jgi:hypothetical protein